MVSLSSEDEYQSLSSDEESTMIGFFFAAGFFVDEATTDEVTADEASAKEVTADKITAVDFDSL